MLRSFFTHISLLLVGAVPVGTAPTYVLQFVKRQRVPLGYTPILYLFIYFFFIPHPTLEDP